MPIHWADTPVGLKQSCAICGAVLVDYTQAIIRLNHKPKFFEGAVETHDQGFTPSLDPPNCCPIDPDSEI